MLNLVTMTPEMILHLLVTVALWTANCLQSQRDGVVYAAILLWAVTLMPFHVNLAKLFSAGMRLKNQ